MRLTYLDLSVSALKKCNADPHHRSTTEEKHCVAQQPPRTVLKDRLTSRAGLFKLKNSPLVSLQATPSQGIMESPKD
jgi:hypothetical protein